MATAAQYDIYYGDHLYTLYVYRTQQSYYLLSTDGRE